MISIPLYKIQVIIIIIASSDESKSETDSDSESGPLQKRQKLSNPKESKSIISQQIHAVLHELSNVLPHFAINFQIQRPPIVVIKTTNSNHITFPIYDRTDILAINKLLKISSPLELQTNVIEQSLLALESKSFEILSSNWNDFMIDELLPMIKLKVGLDVEMKADLKRFIILQFSLENQSICESEEDNTSFATLVIQLPSKYEGGKHVVTCKEIKFSEEFNFIINQEFSMQFIVINHGCHHQIAPITSGVVSYLIYNLNIPSNELDVIPKLSGTLEQEKKATLQNLLSQWMSPSKLIFCLTNAYTKKNLSIKNLQSADLRTMIRLKSLADDCSFQVYLGWLQLILESDVQDENFKFNVKKRNTVAADYHKLECLTDIAEENWVDFSSLEINFKDEVSPINCFDGMKPYRSSRKSYKDEDEAYKWKSSDEYLYSKFYRCPVIVCFKNRNLISNLKGIDTCTKIKIFISLFEKFRSNLHDEKWMEQLRSWAFEIVSIKNSCMFNLSKEDPILQMQLLNIIISFNNLKLLQKFFNQYQTLTAEVIPLLISQCEKYGWNSFSHQIYQIFNEIPKFWIVEKYFKTFISTQSTDLKKLEVFRPIIPLIIKNFIKYRDGIIRLPAVWLLAKSINYDLRAYAKSLPILEMVPVLIQLVESDLKMMDVMWFDVAEYFDKEMVSKVGVGNTKYRELSTKLCTLLQQGKEAIKCN